MAFPTALNGQITDAVTQSNVTVLGQAPAAALGTLYHASAQAQAMALANAVSAQQNLATVGQAALTAALATLVSRRS